VVVGITDSVAVHSSVVQSGPDQGLRVSNRWSNLAVVNIYPRAHQIDQIYRIGRMCQSSSVQAAGFLSKVAVASTGQFLQTASGVYRSLTALGFIVADAVADANVGYAQQSILSLDTKIQDKAGQSLCEDSLREPLDLRARAGIPIAASQPATFFGGLVLAEVIRTVGAWLSTQLTDFEENQLINAVLDPSSSEPITAEQEHQPQALKLPIWLNNVTRFTSSVAIAGSAAMSVAMSAELFRAGVPLMPFYGLNNLQIAEVDTQQLQVEHQYNCDDPKFQGLVTPSVRYDVDAELTLPGVRISNISAAGLIGALFKSGIAAHMLGQVGLQVCTDIRHRLLVGQLKPSLSNTLARQSPQAKAQWLANSLFGSGYLAKSRMPLFQQKCEKVMAQTQLKPVIFPLKTYRQGRDASFAFAQRMAATALVSSYAARLITTGVPFISSGFNGIEAGQPKIVPIRVEKPINVQNQLRGALQIKGEALIPASKLYKIQTTLFAPLMSIGSIIGLSSTLVSVVDREGGFKVLGKAVQAKPWVASSYYMAQTALLASQKVTAALGIFGLSLFLGAQIAADLVGGSEVTSQANLQGRFNFNASLIFNNTSVFSQSLDNTTFDDEVATIELPNPSQISNVTMVVGGVSGSALLMASYGLNRLQTCLRNRSSLDVVEIDGSERSVELGDILVARPQAESTHEADATASL